MDFAEQVLPEGGTLELLPQLFDSLTPNGDTQTESQANKEISDILSQLGNANR